MHRTAILIAGLITMAALSLWCLDRHVGDIQRDILTRTNEALAGAGLPLAAEVSGQDVTLTGMLADTSELDNASALVAALAGVRVVDNRATVRPGPVAPSGPYQLEAELSPQGVVLTGTVPDDGTRASLVGAARQQFRTHTVIDRLQLRADPPAGFADAVKAALPALATLQAGRLRIRDQSATLSGQAADPAAMAGAERSLAASLPPGFSASTQLRLAPAAAARVAGCQSEFDRIMRGQTVRFASGSDRISADSFPLLDDVAAAVKGCVGVAVEIRGHTDSAGAAASNLALSQRRAEAVVDYLIREGVPQGQLSARGFGESQPVASNDTAAGRASNRRIEIRAGDSGER